MILDACPAANRSLAYNSAGVASAAAAAAVSTVPGRLFQVMVTQAGTSALNVYDNASAASGLVVCAIPANAVVGSTYLFTPVPVNNGIFVNSGAGTPGVTLFFNP